MIKRTITFVVLCLILIVFALFFVGVLTDNTTTQNTTIQNTVDKECQHDWVTSSKYMLFTHSYKVVSVCSKCGKEM